MINKLKVILIITGLVFTFWFGGYLTDKLYPVEQPPKAGEQWVYKPYGEILGRVNVLDVMGYEVLYELEMNGQCKVKRSSINPFLTDFDREK